MKIIVTGATEGIGGATALRLAADYAAGGERLELVLTARGRKPAPQVLLDRLAADGVRTTYLTGDLSDPAACADLAARTLDALDGGLDAFVSNAGVSAPHRLADLPAAEWDRTFAINTRPTFLLAQAFRRALAASKGSIVVVVAGGVADTVLGLIPGLPAS